MTDIENPFFPCYYCPLCNMDTLSCTTRVLTEENKKIAVCCANEGDENENI